MAQIESVDQAWQRNHMIFGEGRRAARMFEAEALKGRRGTLTSLKAEAQPLADKCLATFWIRTGSGCLHMVAPA